MADATTYSIWALGLVQAFAFLKWRSKTADDVHAKEKADLKEQIVFERNKADNDRKEMFHRIGEMSAKTEALTSKLARLETEVSHQTRNNEDLLLRLNERQEAYTKLDVEFSQLQEKYETQGKQLVAATEKLKIYDDAIARNKEARKQKQLAEATAKETAAKVVAEAQSPSSK